MVRALLPVLTLLFLIIAPIAHAQPLEGCFSPSGAIQPPSPDPGDLVRVYMWACSGGEHGYAVTYNSTRTLSAGFFTGYEHNITVNIPPQPGYLEVWLDGFKVAYACVAGVCPPDVTTTTSVTMTTSTSIIDVPNDPVMVGLVGGLGVALVAVLAAAARARRGLVPALAVLGLLAVAGVVTIYLVDKYTGGELAGSVSSFWDKLGSGLSEGARTFLVLAGLGVFLALLLVGVAQLYRR